VADLQPIPEHPHALPLKIGGMQAGLSRFRVRVRLGVRDLEYEIQSQESRVLGYNH